jgi:nicotinate-nucleotide pyrophosphorylase (carboxylating)
MPMPDPVELSQIIERALVEDLAGGDVTTDSLIPAHIEAAANLTPRGPGVIAGLQVAEAVFKRVDPSLQFKVRLVDGDVVEGGESVAVVSGSMASILKAERTVLNLVQRMSGIATLTARFVSAVSHTRAVIVDTRKTAPGLRSLDKYAVAAGGGRNHRRNLSDGVLIKDNHIAALQAEGFSLQQIIRRARATAPHTVKIEVEVESVEEVPAAIEGGADIIMLDNMSTDSMRRAVEMCRDRCLTEASGGITIGNVGEVAETGVDIISIGALTHSVEAMDIGLDFIQRGQSA